jgi:riboflavin kinase/FMN adenylyltransferase
MNYSNKLSRCHLKASCIAIGSFDGVHLGHQALIEQMKASASAHGVPSVVVNFYPQPIVILKKLKRDFYITELEERIDLISQLGVDHMVTIPFTEKLGDMTAYKFLRKLKRRLGVKEIWVGEDFALGRDRDADVEHIREIGRELDFDVFAIDRVRLGGADISSSIIRDILRVGYLEGAEQFLGRPFTIYGPVIHGAARGRTLGYPTANVAIDPLRVALRMGVYWTRFTVDGVTYPAATSVGTNPTFIHLENPPISIETYLIDFDGDIYDKMVQIEFKKFLRDQIFFHSLENMVDQLAEDVEVVRGMEQYVNSGAANLLT